MDCSEAREKMELLALGGLPSEQRAGLERHMGECSACRDMMAEYDFVVEELRQETDRIGPDEDWQASTRRAIRREVDESRDMQPTLWRLGYGMAAAAAATILVVAGWLVLYPDAEGSEREITTLTQRAERWSAGGLLAVPRSPATGYVTDGERVYALRRSGKQRFVCAMDAESGRHLWRSEVPALGHLATAESTVFCLSPGKGDRVRLVALDDSSGRVRWQIAGRGRRRLGSPTRPVPTDGGRVCWTVGGTVHMLDVSTGAPLWSRDASTEALLSPPAVADSSVVVASTDGLLCLGLEDGRERWREELPEELKGQVRPLLALSGNRAFLVERDYMQPGMLCCMDLESRTVAWKQQVNRPFSILSRNGMVCLRGQEVVGYDARNGARRWSRRAQGCSPLTASDGMVHFVDSAGDGRLVGVELATGRTAWEIDGVRSCDAFIRSGGIGYVKTRRGTLHAFRLNSSSKL